MIPTIDFGIKVIKRLYGEAVTILFVDDSNKCVNIFFKDCDGFFKEYFQAPDSKYMISNI